MVREQKRIPKACFDVRVSVMEGADHLTYTVETVVNYGPKKEREGHYLSFWTLKEVDGCYILEKDIVGKNTAPRGSITPNIGHIIEVFGVEDKANYDRAKQRLLKEARTFAREYAAREYAQVKDLTLEQRTTTPRFKSRPVPTRPPEGKMSLADDIGRV